MDLTAAMTGSLSELCENQSGSNNFWDGWIVNSELSQINSFCEYNSNNSKSIHVELTGNYL